MAAVKTRHGLDLKLNPHDWYPTPKWHWRYWFGHRMRQLSHVNWRSPSSPLMPTLKFRYRTHPQHARAVLEERYGPKEDPTNLGEAPLSYITPTHDPRIVGQVWNDRGTLRISQG